MRLKSGEKGASGALLVRQCLDLSWHWSGSSAQFLQLPRHCRAQCRPVPSTSSALQCPVSPILPADQCLCPVPAALSASWTSSGERRTISAKLLPRMGVSLSWQDMSQPASPVHPEYSCLSRGHCSHKSVHGISQHFTGGVPRLPRWQPAHATGGCRPGCRNIESAASRPLQKPAALSGLEPQQ